MSKSLKIKTKELQWGVWLHVWFNACQLLSPPSPSPACQFPQRRFKLCKVLGQELSARPCLKPSKNPGQSSFLSFQAISSSSPRPQSHKLINLFIPPMVCGYIGGICTCWDIIIVPNQILRRGPAASAGGHSRNSSQLKTNKRELRATHDSAFFSCKGWRCDNWQKY